MKQTKPTQKCPESLIQEEMNKFCKKFNLQFNIHFYKEFHAMFQTYIYFSHNTKQAANAIIEKINQKIKSN